MVKPQKTEDTISVMILTQCIGGKLNPLNYQCLAKRVCNTSSCLKLMYPSLSGFAKLVTTYSQAEYFVPHHKYNSSSNYFKNER